MTTANPALVRLLGDAVVAELNGQAWPQPATAAWEVPESFNARRAYIVKNDVKDIPTNGDPPLIVVRLSNDARNLKFRNASLYDFSIDVDAQQQVDPNDNDQCDAILDLMEAFANYFSPGNGVTGVITIVAGPPAVKATCVSVEKPALYVPDHLDQYRVCTAVLRLNFNLVA
jgi:hypothetical protein